MAPDRTAMKKLVTVFFVLLVITCFVATWTDAARALPSEEFRLPSPPSENVMAYWIRRLASGPSPKGPGH
ncbi:hypothetical protein M569_11701 [Genlisea aurea]|uniref:Uncharacterized protein n=1 Tax=Genlisea aurea TaxID=192259 RepID=S8DTE5_9LAMI|nr:hypothetical protein M569_11701 [Genlisea aurea]